MFSTPTTDRNSEIFGNENLINKTSRKPVLQAIAMFQHGDISKTFLLWSWRAHISKARNTFNNRVRLTAGHAIYPQPLRTSVDSTAFQCPSSTSIADAAVQCLPDRTASNWFAAAVKNPSNMQRTNVEFSSTTAPPPAQVRSITAQNGWIEKRKNTVSFHLRRISQNKIRARPHFSILAATVHHIGSNGIIQCNYCEGKGRV